jgi:hypothetical protein
MTEPPAAAPTRPVPVPGGGDATPLLLLPVLIETRFMDRGGPSELWVRVYPDQIMANGHHPELTAAELAAGNAYWTPYGGRGTPRRDRTRSRRRGGGVAARYGAPRAAWIARPGPAAAAGAELITAGR